MKRAIIVVQGRVQGVFFRQETKSKAQEFGLLGWVKNEDDGTVKIVAEGEGEKIKELIKWLRVGPRFARVDEVKINWQKAQEEFSQFEII